MTTLTAPSDAPKPKRTRGPNAPAQTTRAFLTAKVADLKKRMSGYDKMAAELEDAECALAALTPDDSDEPRPR